MAFPETERRYSRVQGAAWVACPVLSRAPFPAADVSAGGFRAHLAHKPVEGHVYQVTLWLGESSFGPLPALVAWSRPRAERPGMWSFGMRVMMQDEQRECLAALLGGVSEAA